MDEMNQGSELFEKRELTPEEKKQKSTNRVFGLFLVVDIILSVLLVASIISLIVQK